jgi:hypothetical protein
MNTTPSLTVNTNLVVLAQLLDRLDRSGRAVDAGQFRTVVQRLGVELERAPHDAGLDSVLASFPAAAELYENLNYQHAGLCRSSLEPALAAEIAARGVVDSARRHATQGTAPSQH